MTWVAESELADYEQKQRLVSRLMGGSTDPHALDVQMIEEN